MALGGECGVVVGRFGIVDGRGEVDRLNFNSEAIERWADLVVIVVLKCTGGLSS